MERIIFPILENIYFPYLFLKKVAGLPCHVFWEFFEIQCNLDFDSFAGEWGIDKILRRRVLILVFFLLSNVVSDWPSLCICHHLDVHPEHFLIRSVTLHIFESPLPTSLYKIKLSLTSSINVTHNQEIINLTCFLVN